MTTSENTYSVIFVISPTELLKLVYSGNLDKYNIIFFMIKCHTIRFTFIAETLLKMIPFIDTCTQRKIGTKYKFDMNRIQDGLLCSKTSNWSGKIIDVWYFLEKKSHYLNGFFFRVFLGILPPFLFHAKSTSKYLLKDILLILIKTTLILYSTHEYKQNYSTDISDKVH